MARNGNHADPDGQLAGRVSDAAQRLRKLEQRINHIDHTLETAKGQLGQLRELRAKLDQLESEQKKLRDRERKRERQQAILEKGLLDAADQTAVVQQEIDAIDQVLASGLPSRPPAFSELVEATEFPPFDPATMGPAEPILTLEPDPQPPRFGLFGATGRHERETAATQVRNEEKRAAHSREHTRWQQDLDRKREQYDSNVAAQQAAAERHNVVIEQNSMGFAAGDPDAISWFVGQALARSQYPAWYPSQDRRYKVICRPDRHDLFIELELPPATVIPVVQGYQYLAGQAERLTLFRPQGDVSQQYRRLIAAVALRALSDAMAATAPLATTVRTVTVNGRALGINAATGLASRPHLLSVSASREALSELKLTQVRPEACLVHLGAQISPDPLALQPAEPLERFPAG